jgi:hypothetical protein
MRKRVFVSFDYIHDKRVKDLLIAQARKRNAPFHVADFSLHEKCKTKTWPRAARRRIKEAGMVLVLLGKNTCHCGGVKKEIEMARAMRKPIAQLQPRSAKNARPLAHAGPIAPWTWKRLKRMLADRPQKNRLAA